MEDAGGRSGDSNSGYLALASAELYDPASNVWTAAGALATARSGHTATLLSNGNVLVAGGCCNTSDALASAELYDPVTNAWMAAGALATARSGHTATLLPNGKVLVAGGCCTAVDALASTELYDPATNSWTAAGALATARQSHTATLLPVGKVLAVAGMTYTIFTTTSYFTSAELYDPTTNAWTAVGALATARSSHTATLLPNGNVLVAGGEFSSHLTPISLPSAELYDPATSAWTATGALATARSSHTSTLLPNGNVLVAGGASDDYNGNLVLASAELYDPATNAWTAAGAIGTARFGHTATLLPNGDVLVAGGNSGSISLASAELFDTSSRLINLSARGQIQTGDNVMIGGLIIGGSSPKTVLIRAVGPNLASYGVSGVLANPMLQLFTGQTVIASNDNWASAANAAAIQATGLAPVSPLESAILITLAPGAYTAIVSGVGGGTGVGIVEVFEIDTANAPLINISTRGQVQTGDNVMIGGFIIQGTASQTVLIRAVGPNLANYGVSGVLANPMLQLYSGQTLIASNDNWGSAANAAAIQATGLAPVSPLESAILTTLAPGAYTAIVSGVGGGTGVGIVEVYVQ